jgi:hypothetical protein
VQTQSEQGEHEMTDRELMEMALEYLIEFGMGEMPTAKALRNRLAQPEREWVGLTEYQKFRLADQFHIAVSVVETIEAKLKDKQYG